MILVVGATGYLGSEICRRLAAGGRPIRALIRGTADPSRTEAVRSVAREVVKGDLKDVLSLRRACEGITTVIFTASSTLSRQEGDSIQTVDQNGALALIDAARTARVRNFVYTSFSGNIDDDFPLRNAKRAAERHLKDSGLSYTILRPSYFMEVWLSPALGFDPTAGRVRIFGTGDRPVSWISLGNVAEFAVQCVDKPAAQNVTLELGGPDAVSPNDIVGIFEARVGRRLQVERVDVSALQAQFAGASDPVEKSFAALMLACAAGDRIDMRETLKKVPVRLTSVREYADSVVAISRSARL